ncbi:ras-related protein Rab-42 isoform X3 [Poecile atricapillus]|uniref:ras-related protein Rab-42 isoform X3 n=1 Tax=Poecile atricapillus TaxID=48891 RepID=UPI00273A4D61|nr:ras-related protein Rab-42 isoform X3 [Poecile atricapillus]
MSLSGIVRLQGTSCLSLSWWDTSVTWWPSEPCQQRKPDTSPPPWAWPLWRPRPAATSTWSWPSRHWLGVSSRSVTRSYYRNSAGGMLLFDLTNRASFESIRRWHREVTDTIQPFRMVFLLVGHKSDLSGQRRVGQREAEKLAASLGVQYVETSAKDASNVVQAFQMLTVAIYQALQTGQLVATEAWNGVKSSVPLPVLPKAQALEKEKQKKCSC